MTRDPYITFDDASLRDTAWTACDACGHHWQEAGARSCPACGARLLRQAAGPQPTRLVDAPQPANASGGRGWLVTAAVGVAALLVAGAVTLTWDRPGTSTAMAATTNITAGGSTQTGIVAGGAAQVPETAEQQLTAALQTARRRADEAKAAADRQAAELAAELEATRRAAAEAQARAEREAAQRRQAEETARWHADKTQARADREAADRLKAQEAARVAERARQEAEAQAQRQREEIQRLAAEIKARDAAKEKNQKPANTSQPATSRQYVVAGGAAAFSLPDGMLVSREEGVDDFGQPSSLVHAKINRPGPIEGYAGAVQVMVFTEFRPASVALAEYEATFRQTAAMPGVQLNLVHRQGGGPRWPDAAMVTYQVRGDDGEVLVTAAIVRSGSRAVLIQTMAEPAASQQVRNAMHAVLNTLKF